MAETWLEKQARLQEIYARQQAEIDYQRLARGGLPAKVWTNGVMEDVYKHDIGGDGGPRRFSKGSGGSLFPASIVTTTETENLEDGAKTHTVVEKDNDGNSQTITKKLAPIKNKEDNKTSGFNGENVFDRMALEHSDDYFKTGEGYERPPHESSISNLYSENPEHFLAGPNRAGVKKPVQFLNNVVAPWEQGPSRADQDIFNRAAGIRFPGDEDSEFDKGFVHDMGVMDDGPGGRTENYWDLPGSEDEVFDHPFDKDIMGDDGPGGRTENYWNIEDADFDKGFIHEMGVMGEGEEPTPDVDEDGSIEQEKIDAMWTRKNILMDEDTIRKAGPAAVKSIETLQAELEALKNDPERRHQVYLDFLRENGILKEWRPDLFKALAGAAFRMMMGDSPDDAFSYSFGALQEKKNLEEKRAHEEEIEMIKQGDKTGASIKFSKDAKWVNLGTNENPIRVKMTTTEAGVPVVNYKGKILSYEQLATAGIFPTPYYDDKAMGEHFTSVVDRLKTDIASIGAVDRFKDDEDVQKHINRLSAGNQIADALNALGDDGVNIGPDMDPKWYGVLSNAAENYLEYKQKLTGKNPPKIKDKTYLSFVDDLITKRRFDNAGIPPSEFFAPEFVKEYDPDTETMVDTKELFELNETQYSMARKNAESWFKDFAKQNPTLPGLENAKISRDYFGVAYAAYTEYQKKVGKAKWMLEAQAGYEAGYLPFMYWLREQVEI